jgi:polysaccharide export outer membrane protein
MLLPKIGCALALGAVAVTSTFTPALAGQAPATENRSYQIGPGDILSVMVYRAPDYTSVVEVGADGTIPLGSVGNVRVSGMTAPEAGAEIARRLRAADIFKAPVVNVLVQTYRSRTVSVLGNVTKPGEYPLERGQLGISDVLARAGAVLGAGGGTIELIRNGAEKRTIPAQDVLLGRSNVVLQPSDTLIVNDAATFYISGEVQKGGSYPIEPNLTVGRAIAIAGGLTPRGSSGRVKVTRNENATDRTFKAKSGEPVKPRDLIVVGSRIF